jgi:hypothetical protein
MQSILHNRCKLVERGTAFYDEEDAPIPPHSSKDPTARSHRDSRASFAAPLLPDAMAMYT